MEETNSPVFTQRERKLYRIIGQLIEIHPESIDLILDGLDTIEEMKKEITNINKEE